MSTFLQGIVTDKVLSEAQYVAASSKLKAFYLLRQMFLCDYVRFATCGSAEPLLHAYRQSLLLQAAILRSNLATQASNETQESLETLSLVKQLETPQGIESIRPQCLVGKLDGDYSGLPNRITEAFWQPYVHYRNFAGAVRQYHTAEQVVETLTPQSVTRHIAPPVELCWRKIRLCTSGSLAIDNEVVFDMKTQFKALKFNNVFGLFQCLNWQGINFGHIFARLYGYGVMQKEQGLLQYIRDCILYDGRSSDPSLNLRYYSIDSGQLQAFLTLLLTLKTRDHVKLDRDHAPMLARLLLADSAGKITRRLLTEELPTAAPQTAAVLNRSIESLTARPYATAMRALIMAKDVESLPEELDFAEDETDDKTKTDDDTLTLPKALDFGKGAKTGNTRDSAKSRAVDDLPEHLDFNKDSDTKETDTPEPEADDEKSTAETEDAPEAEDTAEEEDSDSTSDPAKKSTEDSDPTDESATEEPAPESSPSERDVDPGSQSDPDSSATDPEAGGDDEVGSSTTTKIGNLTLAPAEPPSIGATLYRERVRQYLDRIIDSQPQQFTAEEIAILRSLRLYWLYVYSVDTIKSILDKVLTGKKLPKPEMVQ